MAEDLISALVLLCAGASLGLAVWEVLQGASLGHYVSHNLRRVVGFRGALLSIASGAWVVLGGAWLLASQGSQGRALRFHTWATRAKPLLLSALIPPLWQWQPWLTKPLVFLVLLALIALALRRSLTSALLVTEAALQGAGEPTASTARAQRRAAFCVVFVAAAAYGAYFGTLSVQSHHNLHTDSFDLGIFDNLMWNTADRYSFSLPSSPADGPDFRHLERHATFLAFLLAPIYALAPRAETLLWIQAILVGMAALPLFGLAERRIGAWGAALVAVGYLLYPPVHGPNLFDFHFIVFGPLFLWTSLLLLEQRRDWLAAIAILLTLLVREDFAAGVAMIGLYLIVTKQRPLLGLALGAIGCAYVGVMKLIIMPGGYQHGAGTFVDMYEGLVPKGSHGGFGAVIKTLATNPGFTARTLLTQDKLIYVLQLATPLAFLPWLRPIGWLMSLPGFLFCLLVTHGWPMLQISFQYTPHWTAYLFPALIVNVEWLARHAPAAAEASAHKRAALATFALCMLIASHQFGGILQQNTLRSGFEKFEFRTTAANRADYKTLRAMIAEVPKDARIAASETLVPHVSNRRYAYTLRNGIADAEFILSVTDRELLGDERTELKKQLAQEFGVVDQRRRFVLLQRGAGRARNAKLRALLREHD